MTLHPKVKAVLSFVLRFGLSGILFVYLFHQIDIKKTLEIVKTADLAFVSYAFLSFLSIYIFLVWRWMIFMKALGLKIPFLTSVRYYFIGLFGNLFLPSAIGGDVIKMWGLCRYTPEKAKVVASVLMDRLSGFAGIVVVAVAAFTFGYSKIQDMSLLISMSIMAGASIVITLILFNEKIYSTCCRIFYAVPKIKDALMKLHYDVALLKDRRYAIYQAVGVSCICQVILSITFYLLFKALHQDVDFVYCLIFIPLICVASSVPSIGGLGVREAGTTALFKKVGIIPGISFSVGLINSIFMYIVGLLGGLFFWLTRPVGESLKIEEPPH